MVNIVSQEEHERKYKRKCGPPYIVMRRPCIMEDEGRHFFIDKFYTFEEAESWKVITGVSLCDSLNC